MPKLMCEILVMKVLLRSTQLPLRLLKRINHCLWSGLTTGGRIANTR